MLPPVLEIYTVWHPLDTAGETIAQEFFDHFHGTLFSGLMGGAVETYSRSEPWSNITAAPRPIPFGDKTSTPIVPPAEIIVVIPILGNHLARAIETGVGDWFEYMNEINQRRAAEPKRIFVIPTEVDRSSVGDTRLGEMFGQLIFLGTSTDSRKETAAQGRCRDLCQSIAKLAGDGKRIKVFISHTKRSSNAHDQTVADLIETVRRVIAGTRLTTFFDSQDLEVGEEWEPTLVREASSGALLALRTDLYASRKWCQKEMKLSKIAGMPVVILEALRGSENRGSFLMDHVPRVAAHEHSGVWDEKQIRLALGILVDECLKRVLWRRQQALAQGPGAIEVSWWAPHAPEPLTFAEWLSSGGAGTITSDTSIRILHPDPPLGEDEFAVLEQMRSLAQIPATLDIVTPRMLAVRGV
jgi:hypothetical protein